jgi:acetyl-CoA C-acetyltransferase
MVTEDEGVRPETTADTLAKLRPAFSADGTVTAGSEVLADPESAYITGQVYPVNGGLYM